MVCPRCISSVKGILKNLEIPFDEVSLGRIALKTDLSRDKVEKLQDKLKKEGFELITDKHHRVSNQIKSLIIDGIYEEGNFDQQNLSSYLSKKLNQDYSHLTHVFSKTEGKSIREFQQDVKIMRVKELLEYDELNIAEIADRLGYGNAAYLSTHFKKATGLTPSEYKNQHLKKRGSLDEI